MDYKKTVYLTANKYIGKVEYISSGDYDIGLFTKYAEPQINCGGTFDGFTLDTDNKYIKTGSPFSKIFDPVTLGISLDECGERAQIYVDTIAGRIETEMDVLRLTDSTSLESIKTIVI
jgi:hypothetical protein